MSDIRECLGLIQQGLKAPKDLTNKFGGYKYRSAETILEAVKPLLHEQSCILTINDEMVAVGERVYVKATATITTVEPGEGISVSAFAREPEDKKGSDASQITGAASSYARKYALNGLFCIDDTKDADATNDHGKGKQKPAMEVVEKSLADAKTEEEILTIDERLAAYDWTAAESKKIAKFIQEHTNRVRS